MVRRALRMSLKRKQNAVSNPNCIWHEDQSISQPTERENAAREPPRPSLGLLRLLCLAAQECWDVQVVGRDFAAHVGDVAGDLLHDVGLLRRDVAGGGLLA